MKKIIQLCLVAAAMVSCGDKINESGNVITVEREVSGFSAVSVGDGIDATVTIGEQPWLKVTADDNIVPYIETFVDNGTLIIKIKNHTSFRGTPTLRVSAGAVELSGCSASGGSSLVFANRLIASLFRVSLSGGSRCYGSIEAEQMKAGLSGGAFMEIDGTTPKLDLGCSGGAIFTGFGFEADVVNADLSGGSRATLTVNQRLTATASGGSTLRYRGNPSEVSRNTSGGSTIEPAN